MTVVAVRKVIITLTCYSRIDWKIVSLVIIYSSRSCVIRVQYHTNAKAFFSVRVVLGAMKMHV